ncbi:MAG: cell division protein ZapE [Microbacterium sp.]
MRRPRRDAPRPEPGHPVARATAPLFQTAVDASNLSFDRAQRAAIAALADPSPHGYYLWGDVGRGKSLLAELYLDSVRGVPSRRFHFHEFFRELHAEIAGTRQPLDHAIARTLGPARAVLFDEFHVHDVADAVFLTATLRSLIERDVLLVATSNYPPDGLLPNPLQHRRFLPAIRLIESRLRVVGLGQGPDHRRTDADLGHAHGFGSGAWTIEPARSGDPDHSVPLTPNGIPVTARAAGADGVTFDYAELFDRPLGVREYLWIAERYPAVTICDVPDLAQGDRDGLLRFSGLVDVLYDRDVPLTVRAAGPPDALLAAQEPPRDAARTISRLATLAVSRAEEEVPGPGVGTRR